MESFLASTPVIDWDTPVIKAKAQELAVGLIPKVEIAQSCFEFVRDEIKHSMDYKMNPATCKASDVLKHGTGFCYAKSHLLAALLRANDIQAALCYQRLTLDDDGENGPYCLHGLNAIYLEEFGWFRVDPRGNKPGVDAQFCPPIEKLAFNIRVEGEADFPDRYAEPLDIVVQTLQNSETYLDVANNLPDLVELSAETA